MACPVCSWSPDNPDYHLIGETRLWRVVLAPNQCLVGRCVVHLKRHAGELADLTQGEMADWLAVVRALQAAVRSAFGATMFNWSCYENHAYRERPPNPHVHWWAVPRYDHPVTVGVRTFTDPSFGQPYDHDRWATVPGEVQQQIGDGIRHAIRFEGQRK